MPCRQLGARCWFTEHKWNCAAITFKLDLLLFFCNNISFIIQKMKLIVDLVHSLLFFRNVETIAHMLNYTISMQQLSSMNFIRIIDRARFVSSLNFLRHFIFTEQKNSNSSAELRNLHEPEKRRRRKNANVFEQFHLATHCSCVSFCVFCFLLCVLWWSFNLVSFTFFSVCVLSSSLLDVYYYSLRAHRKKNTNTI